jgi:hypothetical protein
MLIRRVRPSAENAEPVTLRIGDQIEIQFWQNDGRGVKIAIDAPKDLLIQLITPPDPTGIER